MEHEDHSIVDYSSMLEKEDINFDIDFESNPLSDAFLNFDNIVYSENEDFIDDDDQTDRLSDDGVQDDHQIVVSNNDKDEYILDDEFKSTEIKSPGGSRSLFWIPIVDKAFEPAKKVIFSDLQSGIDYYIEYSKKAGFDYRLGGNKKYKGVLRYKYVYCNRQGKADTRDVDTLKGKKGKKKRKYPSKMTSCPAFICFKCVDGTQQYFVNSLEKMHNHPLYTKATMHMSKHKRKLDFYDKTIIQQLNTSNVGPTRAHAMIAGLKGGYENQGPKKIDYKNHSRDLNCYIGSSDAHSLVKIMELRQKNVPNFSFDYFTEENELRGMFWADGIAKRNYQEFSDVVSFDATFKTNKYNMVFVPFTGIDNHKRCITFGAGLLAKETIEYYTWLLEAFVKVFGEQPRIVVTDQDPAMARAVRNILPQSTHRLCMWHIGKKLTDKVSSKLIRQTDFRKWLQSLIWNSWNSPEEFEAKWSRLINKFNLSENKWLNDMYAIRSRWIPAYFKDTPLSGLMRTTSRSESENYFFQSFMSKKSNLLMFMCKFDAAMDKQRSVQASSDFDSVSKAPAIESRLAFEVQASKFYTLTMFNIFQKELHDALWTCSPGMVVTLADHKSCFVVEKIMIEGAENRSIFVKPSSDGSRHGNKTELQYQVSVFGKDESFQCSCLLFEQYGVLCRHILCIMKQAFIKEIPVQYLLRRWKKDIISPEELQKNYSFGDVNSATQNMVRDTYSIIFDCLNIVSHDPEAFAEYIKWKKEIKAKLQSNPPKKDVRTRSERLSACVGVSVPEKVVIQNPSQIRNKGSGSSKRMRSKREIAMKNVRVEGRTCHFCEKKIPPSEKHDKRNCPIRLALKKQQEMQNQQNHDSEEEYEGADEDSQEDSQEDTDQEESQESDDY